MPSKRHGLPRGKRRKPALEFFEHEWGGAAGFATLRLDVLQALLNTECLTPKDLRDGLDYSQIAPASRPATTKVCLHAAAPQAYTLFVPLAALLAASCTGALSERLTDSLHGVGLALDFTPNLTDLWTQVSQGMASAPAAALLHRVLAGGQDPQACLASYQRMADAVTSLLPPVDGLNWRPRLIRQ